MRVLAMLVLAVVVWGVASLAGDYFLYQHGQELVRQIEAEQLTDPEQIWTKWTELSNGNSSSLLLHGPRKAVKQRLVP